MSFDLYIIEVYDMEDFTNPVYSSEQKSKSDIDKLFDEIIASPHTARAIKYGTMKGAGARVLLGEYLSQDAKLGDFGNVVEDLVKM